MKNKKKIFSFFNKVSNDLNSIGSYPTLNSNNGTTPPFKCTTDGLFEDEHDCQMYYECLWIGTAFEKQEHLRCQQRLIYNPRKHRCDNIFEFETQFANGIQTGEELIEFMRFRNCIGSRNMIVSSSAAGASSGNLDSSLIDPNMVASSGSLVRPYKDQEDPYYSMLTANTSPPADYWPQIYLLDEGGPQTAEKLPIRQQLNDEMTSTTTSTTMTTTTTIKTTTSTSTTSTTTSTLPITESNRFLNCFLS